MANVSSNQFRSACAIILGCSLTSLSPFFVEFSGVSAVVNSFYRMGIGGLVFFLIALFRKKEWPKGKSLWVCLIAALVIAVDLAVLNQSVLYIGPGISTILANLQIVFLVLIGTLLYGETLPPYFLQLGLLILLGVLFLIYPYLSDIKIEQGLGIILGLGASFLYGIYLTLLKIIQKSGPSSLSILAVVCPAGAAILALAIWLNPSMSFVIPNFQGGVSVVLNGLLSQVAGWLLIANGLNRISFSLSGLLMLAQPAIAFIIDFLIFSRNQHSIQLIGCAVLLAAVYGATWLEKNRIKDPTKISPIQK